MKKLNIQKPDFASTLNSRAFRVGGYSIVAAAIVIAIAIAANIFVETLPASVTQFDTTANQLFTITEQTEDILADLESDVTIYWIAQAAEADTTLELLLEQHDGMSEHISVVKKDPDIYPTFAQQYTSESISNNSLIVECGTRSRYVTNSEIYEYDYSNYYYDGSYSVSFAGESAVTSAISYVTNEDLPKIYTLTGHGESTLSSDYQAAVEKQNMETEELSLLTVEAVPEDADCIFIYAPQSDISSEEKEMLLAYLQGGGNLFLITDPEETSGSRPNLDAVMAEYGLTATEGIVIEGDGSHYALNVPYYLLPKLESHEIVAPLTDNNYYVLLTITQGLTISDDLRESLTVEELLTTSDSAFSKVSGYNLQTYEKEEGDVDGPFVLAAAAADVIDEETTSHIVWVSSASIADDQANAQISGGNQDFFINALGWMCDHEDSISIHSRSLDYEYLTMDSGTASILSIVLVGVIPVAYLVCGITIWIRRKRR